MQPRIAYTKVAPGATRAMRGLEEYLAACGLEPSLLDLVRTRASQINGCAYCIDMHTKDARARGESEQRLYTLDAWRETPFYTERERAALAWTEAVTLITNGHVPDAVYEEVRQHLSEWPDIVFIVVCSSLLPPRFAPTVAGLQKAASAFVRARNSNPKWTASAGSYRKRMS